jgi:hypothetical protein
MECRRKNRDREPESLVICNLNRVARRSVDLHQSIYCIVRTDSFLNPIQAIALLGFTWLAGSTGRAARRPPLVSDSEPRRLPPFICVHPCHPWPSFTLR